MLLILALGCKKDEPEPAGPTDLNGCDNVDPARCLLPFPSSYFQVAADTPTGLTLAIPDASMPIDRDGTPLRPVYLNEFDGYMIAGAMMTFLDGVDPDASGVATHLDIARSLDADSPTVVIDADTGERVAHWVELDLKSDLPEEQLLHLWPAVPLQWGHRYVVGIRDMVDADGAAIEPSRTFAALRDGTDSDDTDVAVRKGHYGEVFGILADQGVDRGDLQVAWDFTTASRSSALGRADFMRDDMLSRFGKGGPDYVIDSVQTEDCAQDGVHVGRTVTVTMTVPYYTERDEPNVKLTRDDEGMPFYVDDTEVDFIVRIPCSVLEDPGKALTIQYGHGFFGDKDEVNTGWLAAFLDEYRAIAFAVEWKGMSEKDVGPVSLVAATDLTDFVILPERSLQGFIEFVAAAELVSGDLATDPDLMVGNTQLLDPDQLVYYGISQGGILGGAYVGLSPHIERAVLGVTGAPYHLLMRRSANFAPFELLFEQKWPSRLDQALLFGVIEQLWCPGESACYFNDVNADVPDGLPTKQVLIQNAMGDAQVSEIAGQLQARAYGAKLVKGAPRAVWGMDEVKAGFEGSALVEFAYPDVPEIPFANEPPTSSNDPHECPRREVVGQEQVITFLATGEVIDPCGKDGCQTPQADLCGD